MSFYFNWSKGHKILCSMFSALYGKTQIYSFWAKSMNSYCRNILVIRAYGHGGLRSHWRLFFRWWGDGRVAPIWYHVTGNPVNLSCTRFELWVQLVYYLGNSELQIAISLIFSGLLNLWKNLRQFLSKSERIRLIAIWSSELPSW